MASIVTLPFTAPKDGILYLYVDPISGGSFYAYYEIKNSKGDTLLPVFSSKEELFKWIKVSDKEIKRLTFKNYSNILLADGNNNVGIVIDSFSSNIVLDKKIVNDISKKFLN